MIWIRWDYKRSRCVHCFLGACRQGNLDQVHSLVEDVKFRRFMLGYRTTYYHIDFEAPGYQRRPITLGCLALDPACAHGYLDIVKLLITAGVPIVDCCLEDACYYNRVPVLKYLVQDCKAELKTEYLTRACIAGALETVKFLVVECGCGVTRHQVFLAQMSNTDQSTAQWLASRLGRGGLFNV